MYPNVYHSDTLPTILEREVFIGRDSEIKELTGWIENSTIISIVGSPGFGKSTLAIHVGHVVIEKGGIAVHYADLCEVQDMTTLNEKLTFLVLGEKRQSSEHLFMWASKLKVATLFIFDNCDEVLHKYKDAFQNLMKNLVRRAQLLKVMLTAKQMTSFLGSFRNFTLRELSTESAANVLQKLSSNLNRTMALEIAKLVGNVPLALQVVGSLLKDIGPSTIANDLRRDPIPTLSPELLPSTERMFTSLNISYHYLSPEHQRCGRLLALFPGSFDERAVLGILARELELELVQDPSKCLRELHYKSLLSYNVHTQRYRFHQLIKIFFAYVSTYEEGKSSRQNVYFLLLHQIYYRELHHEVFQVFLRSLYNVEKYEIRRVFHFIDKERSNIDFLSLTTYLRFNKSLSMSLAENVFNWTKEVAKILYICKSQHYPLLLFGAFTRLKLVEQGAVDTGRIKIHFGAKLLNVLQDLQHILPLAHAILTQNEDIAHVLHVVDELLDLIFLSIEMSRVLLFEFDSEFKSISIQRGLSAYLEKYMDLLIQLSKLEAIVDGKKKAVETLLLRYNRVAELFSFAPANNLGSQHMHIKYHSALAHNYILLGQFDNFLEHWKKILQLKWPLAQCKQVGCTSTQLALAHFGQGDYEQSAEQMKTLLHSKSSRGNRRVRLFILLHKCYMRLGNVEKATHLLAKDHYLSRFSLIRTIKGTDYKNSTNLSIFCSGDHSTVWLLDSECMTISSQNYRTCFILAAFYRSLGSRDATKLGRVLHHVLRHFVLRYHVLGHSVFRMFYRIDDTYRWKYYEVYSGESSSQVYVDEENTFRGLLIMIALFIGIFCVAALGCHVILLL